ncbi:hypothetical protein K435DRAFT_914036 [Dendrothele bispora CBS 962.96]|uniref:Uncharacterized protein n=1 Tax=Dendrothele bispora (strain CBS 962.96) TaxID=1314807 RepID=A0A4S8ML42_DENBC|nr:hypothetical protein K435DRAFT_914036 [Dendrothele bispora CBS 962.96]
MSQSSTFQDGAGNHNGLTQTNYSSAIPDHWTELFPPQRNNAMPRVFKTQHHSLVNGPRGDIFIVYMDTEKAAMEKLQAYGAVQHPPDDLTWLEADDLIISWSMPREDLSSSQIARLQKLQSDLIGPVDLNGPFKPVRQSNGQFIGGTAFERSVRAQPIGGKDARCYPVATSNQVQRWLEAPSIGNKSSLGDTENADLRSRLLKETIDIPLEGLHRVRPDVLQTTAVQADYTNAIRVGSHDNTVWTACQVNFNGSDENIDEPHPDVELELFFLYELGFYWIQREFAVIFFSGLFYHSGREVIWKSPRQDPRVYNLAFAANGNGGIETISVEERNTSTHSYEERNTTTQANYTTDGLRLMDEHSYFLWFTRSCISKCSGFVNQTPPDLRIRIDEELFLSSFSMVHEGTRIQAPSWPMGPGWKGDDVRIGKRYDDLQLLDIEDPYEREREKIRKWNSDEGSDYPYGKKERHDQSMKWKELTKESGQCYPLYTSAGPKATKHGMMSATKRARKAVVNATGVPSPVKRKKRSNNEHSPDTRSLSPTQHDCILIRLLAPEEINLLLQGLREAFPTSSSASTTLSSSSQFAASTSSLTAITISAHTGLSIGGPLLFELTQMVNNNELAGIIDKEDHLLLNMHLWEWLDQCRGSVEELRLGHYPGSWFLHLVRDIKKWMDIQSPGYRVLDANHYLPSLYPTLGLATHDLGDRRGTTYYSDSDACTSATDVELLASSLAKGHTPTSKNSWELILATPKYKLASMQVLALIQVLIPSHPFTF